MSGHVVGIYLTQSAGTPLHSVDSANAHAGAGLEGDRYCKTAGTFSKRPGKAPDPGSQATLIESEALEALHREYDVCLNAAQARRNIVTAGVPLNHLVNREFAIGDVRFRGIRLCEPCGHLESLTYKGVKKGLVHRGGLRAQILTSGSIRVGDPIVVA